MEIAMRKLNLTENDKIVALSIGDPALDDCGNEPRGTFCQQLMVRGLCPPGAICFSKSDVFMAMYAFSRGAPAALIVAGTGSMGIALKKPYCHGGKNEILTVGGWGSPATDPGSGYDIAVRGIRAAMDAFDGIAPSTMLCEKIQNYFHVSSPRRLINIFNGTESTRTQIAAFAIQVHECARAGDDVSAAILSDAGKTLGKYAISLLRRIEGVPCLGIYGSVLLRNTSVQEVFADTVHREYADVEIKIPQQPPEYGAACYAADALGIEREK